jgi:CMP-N,N'-diacetyllegionaminic acid synthase
MKILSIIPARGGSKGIHKKNIKLLAGKPLIAWTIETAIQSQSIDTVIVSTDDQEIATVAIKFEAEVPFMRPNALSQDDTPGIAPVLHAIQQLPGFDWVILLQPTSPLRTVEDIEGIIQLCRNVGAQSAVSITEVNQHPFWMYQKDDKDILKPLPFNQHEIFRRQDLPSFYSLNGALYLANIEWLIDNQSFIGQDTLGYVMPNERSADIDTTLDWAWVEFLIQQKNAK